MNWFKLLFPMLDEWMGLRDIDPLDKIEAHSRELAFARFGCKTDLAKTIFQFIETESESILRRKEKMEAKLELPDFEIRVANQVDRFGIWFQDLRVPRYKRFKYAVSNGDFEHFKVDFIDCEFENKPVVMHVNIESHKVKRPRKMVATAWSGIGVWQKPSEFTEIESSWTYEYDTDQTLNELKLFTKQYIQEIENHINRNTIFINSTQN